MELMVKMSKRKTAWRTAGLVLAALALSAGCGFSPEAREARFLDAGKKALAKKDYPRAIIQFNNARRMKKDDAEPYYQLGLAFLAMRDYRSSAAAFHKALQLNPKHVQAQLKMAELLAATGTEKNAKDSEERVRKVLAVTPNDTDALNTLAVAEWELGNRRNAELDLLRALGQAPQNLQASVNLARIKIAAHDLAGAEQIIQKACAASPNSASPVLALAELYRMMGKPDAAEQQYQRALRLDPKNGYALLSLANLYSNTGRAEMAENVYRQVSNLPDRSYKPMHAMFLFREGKRNEAVSEFEKLASRDPSDRAARSRLVEAYFAVNRAADAQKVLDDALNKNGKDLDALLQRSRVYLAKGNYAEAQKDVALVLRLQANSAPAHYIMSRISKARGETLSQRQELTEALRLNPYLLGARIELAQILIASKGGKAALDLMNQTPTSQRGSLKAVIERNWALLATGDLAGARQGVDQGLAIARARNLLIQDTLLKLQQKNIPAARQSIEEVLNQNPEDLGALDLMVGTYRLEKKPAAIGPKLREYAEKHPKSAVLQTCWGEWLLANGEAAKAQAAFASAEALDPGYLPAKIDHARADAASGNLGEARKILSNVLQSGRRNVAAELLMGDMDVAAGDRAAALEQYRKVLDSDPNNVPALNNTAFLLAEYVQKPDEALNYAQRAKELSPDDPEIEDTLGWVLYRKGLYDVALGHFQAAAAAGNRAQSEYHLAMAYFKLGNTKQGHQALELALRKDPKLPEAKSALDLQAQSPRR